MRNVVRVLLLLLVVSCGSAVAPALQAAPAVDIDDTTSREIDDVLALRVGADNAGEAIERVSRQFLGTPYGANTLVGSATQAEELVIDFRRVDCFTYLDYVEALRRSVDRDQFVRNLVDTRYANGIIDFRHRKHFFTDWVSVDAAVADDITATLSSAAVTVDKQLNAKVDGGAYVPGIPVVDRAVTFIPSAAVDGAVVGKLRTGDYIGAYADLPGLDVTHVGIFVMSADGPVLRNASSLSANNAVVDSPLDEYLQSVPGIVVLRAR